MTFSIDNPEGGCNNPPPPPLGKYVWEKPSGEQGLKLVSWYTLFVLLYFHAPSTGLSIFENCLA